MAACLQTGACVLPRLVSSFFMRIKTQLTRESENPHAEFPIRSITFIKADVKRPRALHSLRFSQIMWPFSA